MSTKKVVAAENVIKVAKQAVHYLRNPSRGVSPVEVAKRLQAALDVLEPKSCDCKNTAKRRHQLSIDGQTAANYVYDEELAGPDGCRFWLLPSPTQYRKGGNDRGPARCALKRDRDVIGSIAVLRPCPHEEAS